MEKMTQRRGAVLWDLDGTLVDSEEYHWLAWKEIFDREGIPLTRAQFLSSFGQRNDRILRGWRPQAIASSAPRLNVEAVLDALRLRKWFQATVSAEDVQAGKPDPQVFLVAAARLNSAPGTCIVVEDAGAGVEAARRAGMLSIGVGKSASSLGADLAAVTLSALPADSFWSLLATTSSAIG